MRCLPLGKKRTKLVEARQGYNRKDGMWGTDDLGVLPCLFCFLPSLFFLSFQSPADRFGQKKGYEDVCM